MEKKIKATKETISNENIDNIIMVTNSIEKKPYTIEGTLKFNVMSDDSNNTIIQGTLTSEFFIEESDDIYQVDTWRFCLNHVSVKMLECTSKSSFLIYHFVANSFSIKA